MSDVIWGDLLVECFADDVPALCSFSHLTHLHIPPVLSVPVVLTDHRAWLHLPHMTSPSQLSLSPPGHTMDKGCFKSVFVQITKSCVVAFEHFSSNAYILFCVVEVCVHPEPDLPILLPSCSLFFSPSNNFLHGL